MVYISYKKRQRYTPAQISDRMVALGLPVVEPGDDEILAADVAAQIETLDDSLKYNDIAVMVKGEYSPDVMICWAKLAQALRQSVSLTDYHGFKIRELKPEDERRETAVRLIKSRVLNERKDAAITSLLADEGITPETPDESMPPTEAELAQQS